MTYHTCRCPHCRNIVNRAKGNPSYIGNPLRKCPWCQGVYLDTFTEEWAMKSPFKRFKFFIGIPLLVAFFVSIFTVWAVGAIMGTINWIVQGIGLISAIFAFYCAYNLRKGYLSEDIDESIKRTKSASYVDTLLSAGVKIYPIKGVEIGTELDDEKSEQDSGDKNIKKQTDKAFIWH